MVNTISDTVVFGFRQYSKFCSSMFTLTHAVSINQNEQKNAQQKTVMKTEMTYHTSCEVQYNNKCL